VLVTKNSWQHTEVQWTAEARAACQELREASDDPASRSRGCTAMRNSIARAAVEGRITFLDE